MKHKLFVYIAMYYTAIWLILSIVTNIMSVMTPVIRLKCKIINYL